jgi:hypothetical protein
MFVIYNLTLIKKYRLSIYCRAEPLDNIRVLVSGTQAFSLIKKNKNLLTNIFF